MLDKIHAFQRDIYLPFASFFQVFNFTADDLTDQGEIGRGNFGTVNKMYHEQSATIMAVKVSLDLGNGSSY